MTNHDETFMTLFDTLILDIEGPVFSFKAYLKPEDQVPEFVNDVVHTIVSCITDVDTAEYELRNLMNEIAYAHGMYSDGEVRIEQRYAPAVFELGKKILKQLIEYKAFDEAGEMAYEYSNYEHPEFKGTILKRVTN